MTKLSNIKKLGRYKNIETGKEYNLKKGRNMQRKTDLIFYLYRGKRIFVSDFDFYSKKLYEKVSLIEEELDINSIVNKKEVTLDDITKVINKLPHSKERVPYTYHHDYLRQHSEKFKDLSRNEVATQHNHSDKEMYAVALVQILDDVGSSSFIHLGDEDIRICKKVVAITDYIINN